MKEENITAEKAAFVLGSGDITTRAAENSVLDTLDSTATLAVQGDTLTAQSSTNELGRDSSPHSNIDEDEQQSAAESIDSSELSNRLAVLVPTLGESEENTRDSTTDLTVPRSPMDVDSFTIAQASIEDHPTIVATSLSLANEPEVNDPSTTEDFREILGSIIFFEICYLIIIFYRY